MSYIFKYSFLFTFGGLAYLLIEIMFRGYTHWSMGILGGLCFVFIGLINTIMGFNFSLILQMLISSIIITILELLTGLLLNVYLDLNIWDYSAMPFNFMGQICLLFSIGWCFLSLVAIFADDFIRWKIFHESKPHYRL